MRVYFEQSACRVRAQRRRSPPCHDRHAVRLPVQYRVRLHLRIPHAARHLRRGARNGRFPYCEHGDPVAAFPAQKEQLQAAKNQIQRRGDPQNDIHRTSFLRYGGFVRYHHHCIQPDHPAHRGRPRRGGIRHHRQSGARVHCHLYRHWAGHPAYFKPFLRRRTDGSRAAYLHRRSDHCCRPRPCVFPDRALFPVADRVHLQQ
ncbi:hypothetical protein SDC9_182367 [bioreactor metagenome]|uniref:Uncharacterized protein n=1 Tax=bioreactor metagenome TaxID=1076179 RepID=A0A645HGR8_9ZZZZ